jgi:hypothetical protein
MKRRVKVPHRLRIFEIFACTKLPKVFARLGAVLDKEFQLDATKGCSFLPQHHVEKDNGVASFNGLHHGRIRSHCSDCSSGAHGWKRKTVKVSVDDGEKSVTIEEVLSWLVLCWSALSPPLRAFVKRL